MSEAVSSPDPAPNTAPHSNPPPAPAPNYNEVDYRKVSKALQFLTDRTKPLFVPVFCKLWDSLSADVTEKIVAAQSADELDAALSVSAFPITDEVREFVLAAFAFRQSLK